MKHVLGIVVALFSTSVMAGPDIVGVWHAKDGICLGTSQVYPSGQQVLTLNADGTAQIEKSNANCVSSTSTSYKIIGNYLYLESSFVHRSCNGIDSSFQSVNTSPIYQAKSDSTLRLIWSELPACHLAMDFKK